MSKTKNIRRSVLGVSAVAVVLLSAGLTSSGCTKKDEAALSATGFAALVNAEEHVLSHYEELSHHAAELTSAALTLCRASADSGAGGAGGGPGIVADALLDTQQKYDAAREQWLLNRVFAFGPEVEQPLRFGPKIDWQPQATEQIEELLLSTDPIPAPGLLGAQLRGFSVLEYFLFGPGKEQLVPGERACKIVLQTAGDLETNTTELYEQWSPNTGNYVVQLAAHGQQSELFDSPHDALSALVNRMGYVVENLRDRDLLVPLGQSAETARVDLVISRQSQRSLQDLRDTLRGVELLYFGADGKSGVAAYARDEGHDLDQSFQDLLDAARGKIDALEPHLDEQIQKERAAVLELDAALEELQLFFQVDIIGQLSLSHIFNDADGD